MQAELHWLEWNDCGVRYGEDDAAVETPLHLILAPKEPVLVQTSCDIDGGVGVEPVVRLLYIGVDPMLIPVRPLAVSAQPSRPMEAHSNGRNVIVGVQPDKARRGVDGLASGRIEPLRSYGKVAVDDRRVPRQMAARADLLFGRARSVHGRGQRERGVRHPIRSAERCRGTRHVGALVFVFARDVRDEIAAAAAMCAFLLRCPRREDCCSGGEVSAVRTRVGGGERSADKAQQ